MMEGDIVTHNTLIFGPSILLYLGQWDMQPPLKPVIRHKCFIFPNVNSEMGDFLVFCILMELKVLLSGLSFNYLEISSQLYNF